MSGVPVGALAEAVADKPVVLCLGSGGVGKTTTSAALGLALANRGERVVVLTIDPARRLADTLGRRGELGNEPVQVDRSGAAGELWAVMLDPKATFEQLIDDEATEPGQAERILSNPLFTNLTDALSGTNEYMAAERLHQLRADDRFDRIIVDTPPSRHAFDFLDSPSRLTRFVDHRLYRSVLAPRSGVLKSISAGTQLAMRLLARLVGSNLVSDVVAFFADFEGLDEGFRRRAVAIDRLLAGDETAYLLITAPRYDPLREADWILDNLRRRKRELSGIVVNRVLPVEPTPAGGGRKRRKTSDPLAVNLRQLADMAAEESELIDTLETKATKVGTDDEDGAPVLRIAEQPHPISDMAGLQSLAAEF